MFGADILWKDGEIIWNGDDIAITEGVDNVKQQAYLRFICDLGESLFFDWYGELVSFSVGKPYTRELASEVEEKVKEGLFRVGAEGENQTPWIKEIIEVRYYETDDDGQMNRRLYVKFIVRDSNDEPQEVDFELEGGS